MGDLYQSVVWTHKKSGGLYQIISFALREEDLEPMVVYSAFEVDGPIWIRPAKQFFDGRFVIEPEAPWDVVQREPDCAPDVKAILESTGQYISVGDYVQLGENVPDGDVDRWGSPKIKRVARIEGGTVGLVNHGYVWRAKDSLVKAVNPAKPHIMMRVEGKRDSAGGDVLDRCYVGSIVDVRPGIHGSHGLQAAFSDGPTMVVDVETNPPTVKVRGWDEKFDPELLMLANEGE